MSEPRIQYAKTTDGVSIAYWVLGEGMPLVHLTPVFSHIQLEWRFPEIRRWYEGLTTNRRLVRYDPRASGLSDRDVADVSMEASLLDLEAVVDRLDLEKFALVGLLHTGPLAVTYAARHPERVSKLVLWCTYAQPSEFSTSPEVQAARRLLDSDWQTYSETTAHVYCGWEHGQQARRFAALVRESTTPEIVQRFLDTSSSFDATASLSRVKAPALVVHKASLPLLSVSVAQDLAKEIPDARLVLLEGKSLMPWADEVDPAVQAIIEFLDEGGETETAAPSGLITILFTDIESSAALRQRLGDAKAQELVHHHDSIVRDALKAHRGKEVKHTGDGIMSSFATASSALEAAIAIQRGIAAHVQEHPDAPLGVYIGLNAGEPIAEERDLFGTSVDLARRICDHAQPGQVLVSDVVRQLAAGKDFLFSDCGETEMRGFEDPVRLYEVRWQEDG